MNNSELVFRIAVGVLMAMWMFTRFHFQRRLGSVERASRRHDRRERISYALVSVSFIPVFVYVFSSRLDLFHFALPGGWRWLGAALGVAGCALFWWTHAVLGRNWSGVLELSRDHRLVTAGPYRSVRHPMYTAFFLMSAGVLLLSANFLVGGLNLAAVTYMYLLRVADEEAMMLEQFGDEYRRYMKRTGRLLPKLARARGEAAAS